MTTPVCKRCGCNEALHHRLEGSLQDPSFCTLCQGQLKKQQEDDLRAKGKPTLSVSLGDLLRAKQ